MARQLKQKKTPLPPPTRFPFPQKETARESLGAAGWRVDRRALWREGGGGKRGWGLPQPVPPAPRDRLPVSICLAGGFVSDTETFCSPPAHGCVVGERKRGEQTGNAGLLLVDWWAWSKMEPTENAIQIWSQNPSGWVHTTCFSCFAIRRFTGLKTRTDGAHVGNFVCQGPEAARRHREQQAWFWFVDV